MRPVLILLLLLLPGLAAAQPAAEGAELQPEAPVSGPATPAVAAPVPAPPASHPATAANRPPAPPPLSAASSGTAGPMSPAELDRLAGLLRDDARRSEFLRLLEALSAAQRAQPPGQTSIQAPRPAAPATAPTPAAPPAAAAAPAPATPAAPAAEPLLAPDTVGAQLLQGLTDRIAALSDGMISVLRSATDVQGLWQGVQFLMRDPVAQARLLDAAWKLLLLLGLGVVAELLVAASLARPRRWLDAAAPDDGDSGQGWTHSWLRRVPLVLGRLALDLVPIAAFVLAFHTLIGLVQPLPTTQRVGQMAVQAYLGARLAFALARMLLSPSSNHLRLIPCSDAAAGYSIGWLRRLMLVGVGGHTLAEAGIFFGLSWAAYDALLRLTLLVMTALTVRIILQQRGYIAAMLHSRPLAPDDEPDGSRRALRALRDGLAQWWHVLAILWLVAFWAVWALEIERGFQRLAWATLVTVVAGLLAKVVDEGLRRLLAWGLRPGPELAARFPGLQQRADRYLPILQGLASLAVVAAVAVTLLEAWGIDALDWFDSGTLGHRLLATLLSIGLTLVLGLLVWELANAGIQRHLEKLGRDQQASRTARLRTLLPMLRTALAAVIAVFVALNALDKLGVNVAPLLAGAGVIGLAVGFGAQTLVRDVITGVFLLLEDAVAVGDVAQLAGQSGVVEQLSIRAIKLRAADGSLHIIPFSAVTTVTNMTRDFSFAVLDVTVGYNADTDEVTAALREIGGEMRTEAKWNALMRDDIEVIGVEKLADSGVVIRARIKAEPAARWQVARELNRRVKRRFEELGIALSPGPQKLLLDGGEIRPLPARAAE